MNTDVIDDLVQSDVTLTSIDIRRDRGRAIGHSYRTYGVYRTVQLSAVPLIDTIRVQSHPIITAIAT